MLKAEERQSSSLEGNQGFGDVEGSGTCRYTLKNGGSAVANLDYLRPESAPSHGDDRLRVVGEKGIIEVRDEKAILRVGSETEELIQDEEVLIYADFIAQIKSGKACRLSTEDIFGVAKLTILTQEAADTQTVLSV